MFDSLNDLAEFFRAASFPFSIIYFLPLILILAHDPKSTMVDATQEFQVFRMQQYDMPFGNILGSRANSLSMEARTINSKPSFISRRCVLVKLDDFTLERYRTLTANYVGAIIVILPSARKYNDAQKQLIRSLETHLLHEEVKKNIA